MINLITNNKLLNTHKLVKNLNSYEYISNFSNEQQCLSSLLPYDLEKKNKGYLQSSLKEYRMLLEAFSNALKAFKNDELEKFDALVGENACQIRAIKIALIIQNNTISCILLEDRIQTIKSSIDELLLSSNINKWMATEITFKDLLKQKNLSLPLIEDELFLLKTFLLTEVKTTNVNDKMFSSFSVKSTSSHKKLIKYENVSSTFLERLIKKVKFLLSDKSVDLIKETAINDNELSLISKSLDDFTIEYRGLSCIPIYWSVKTILNIMSKNNIPLVIHVKFIDKNKEDKLVVLDEDLIIYQPKKNLKGTLNFIMDNTVKKNSPVIVFEGIVPIDSKNISKFKDAWRNSLASFPITKIILANAAAHRQYPEETLDELMSNHNDNEYEQHKVVAKEIGCTIKNPKIFLLRHIHTSKVEKLSVI